MLYISSVLCLLYLGGKGYIENTKFLGQTLTSGTIVTFYMYISKFFDPIQNLAEQFNWLQSAFASAEKVFSIIDLPLKLTDAENAVELTEVRGEIEFKDVWFSYVPGEWVLKGVSFHVNPKETVAFVGSTGSGKTTILSLICRNYEFQKGQILIDGVDIRKIKIASFGNISDRCFRTSSSSQAQSGVTFSFGRRVFPTSGSRRSAVTSMRIILSTGWKTGWMRKCGREEIISPPASGSFFPLPGRSSMSRRL